MGISTLLMARCALNFRKLPAGGRGVWLAPGVRQQHAGGRESVGLPLVESKLLGDAEHIAGLGAVW